MPGICKQQFCQGYPWYYMQYLQVGSMDLLSVFFFFFVVVMSIGSFDCILNLGSSTPYPISNKAMVCVYLRKI
jgi:hypothetical protein